MSKNILVLHGEISKNNKCYKRLHENIKKLDSVFVVDRVNRSIDYPYICSLLQEYESEKVIFLDTNVYGPIKDIKPLIDAFSVDDNDLTGLIFQPAFSEGPDELFNEGISPECFVMSKRLISEIDIADIFEKLILQGYNRFSANNEMNIIQVIQERGFNVSGLINRYNFEDFSIDAGYDYVKNKSYKLLANTICPFVFKRRFEADNNLTDDLNRMLMFIRETSSYDVDMMLEDVARTINPLDSKRNLNLNYIIPSEIPLYKEFDESIYSETAVFAHIYYEDRVENCFEYLKQVPEKVHKYLTTSNPATYEYLEDKIRDLDETWNLKMVKNHGRDISALWVVDAPLLKKYKYVCYVHDKKTSGQTGNILNGDYYHYNVWENCLKTTQYIKNVLYTLSTKKQLGFLSPPFPIFFDYKGLLGYEWTICYEPTVALANDLGIKANIDSSKPPFAFSNTFWAKTDALLPLIDRKLQYDDFPGEPLPIDGSISHAIERIYIYVAQSQGYLSGIVENDAYASMELNSMQKIMASRNIMLNNVRAECSQQWNRAEKLQQERDLYKNALQVASDGISAAKRNAWLVRPDGNVYIYGSGKIGKRTAQLLMDNGCKIKAFVVSDGQELEENVNGIKCVHFSDVSFSDDDNLVIALNATNYQQVQASLLSVPNKIMYSEIPF